MAAHRKSSHTCIRSSFRAILPPTEFHHLEAPMRKPASYGLAVLCASLLFSLSGSFAQRLPNYNGRNNSTTPMPVSVDVLNSCDLDNQAAGVGGGVLLFDSQLP